MLELTATVLAMVAALLAYDAADSFRSAARGSPSDPRRQWALAISWLMLARSAVGLALHLGWQPGLAWFLAWAMVVWLAGIGEAREPVAATRGQAIRTLSLAAEGVGRPPRLRVLIPILAAAAISIVWIDRGRALETSRLAFLDAEFSPVDVSRVADAEDIGPAHRQSRARDADSQAVEFMMPKRMMRPSPSQYEAWAGRSSVTKAPAIRQFRRTSAATTGPRRALYAGCQRSRL
ncbi:MAG: hypothetical protein MPN21_23440 [Thermoanaerobaculia bacterium]|nr:hypothetical protein [Thermoanaerobaculia bacterium]